ncbi:hypothetical protein JTB14_010159 [Gonioctena quinquepunctata]|nr:hypothetical protein JTB14_010159 [Gonioctena quinquepunctata]
MKVNVGKSDIVKQILRNKSKLLNSQYRKIKIFVDQIPAHRKYLDDKRAELKSRMEHGEKTLSNIRMENQQYAKTSRKKKRTVGVTNISINYTNILSAKFNALVPYISTTHPSIILISETCLESSIPDALNELPGYTLYRSDGQQNRAGGGVCWYVNNDKLKIYSHPLKYKHSNTN